MAAGTYDITIEQGADLDLTFAFTVSGAVMPLTGFTAQMQIRTEPGGDVVLNCTQYLVIDEPGGIVTLSIPAAVTAAINTAGAHDIILIAPDSKVARELQGSVTLSRRVTVQA